MSASKQQTAEPPPTGLSPSYSSMAGSFRRSWAPLAFYTVLAAVFLWRSTFTASVFLPADMLSYAAPWKALPHAAALPPWNPLRWDGIAQFYPWRLFAARSMHNGELPLWNPYQFCGTPFVANSQSAPFYPGNLLFYLLSTSKAFGWSALLHLTLCGWFTYLFLRKIQCSEFASLLGGTAFAYSAWQVAWLQLPTFLATSCWFPMIFGQVYAVFKNQERVRSTGCLGLGVGMVLLAGHLQIAFYGILAASLWGVALAFEAARGVSLRTAAKGVIASVAALGIGLCLGAVQLLPSAELSHLSHRVGPPTQAGYELYASYALPAAGLIQIGLPDFFGGYTDPSNLYWGFYVHHSAGGSEAVRHNAAETALYVGILPVMLGIAAAVKGMRRNYLHGKTLFFVLLALLALLMALGTPIDAVFYFKIPGFSQSGSPARALVLWSFAWSVLAAIGLDTLSQSYTRNQLIAVAAGYALVLTLGLSMAATSIAAAITGFKQLGVPLLGEAFARITEDWIRLAVFGVSGALLFMPEVKKHLIKRFSPFGVRGGAVGLAAVTLVAVDLFLAGIRVNPVASPDSVYADTPGIKYLQANTGHGRIYPVNMFWSLTRAPHAVLPPNAATVYQLRDVQGYDSLLTGAYKRWADHFSLADTRPAFLNRRDSAPVEVGNMVFFQDPNLPDIVKTSATVAITPAAEDTWTPSPAQTPGSSPIESGDPGMVLFPISGSVPRAQLASGNGESVGSVEWLEDGGNRVTLETDAPTPSRLNLNDQNYPGWKAKVDGVMAPVSSQAGLPIFRSVSVPAGKHRVEFLFNPASFRLGLFLFLMAIGALFGMLTPRRTTAVNLTV